MATRTIHEEFVVLHPPEQAVREWQTKFNGWLGESKYAVSHQTADSVSYTRTYTPGFAIFFAIILFPIGLLFLLSKRQHTLSLMFRPHPSGAAAVLSGSGSSDTAEALQGVARDHNQKAESADALPPGAAGPPPVATTPAQQPSSVSNTIEDLERLQRLRDGGTLSQEDFEIQREKVLGGDS